MNFGKQKIVTDNYKVLFYKYMVIGNKFGIGESKELVRKFKKKTHILIATQKQLNWEEREKEWDLKCEILQKYYIFNICLLFV